MKKALFAFAAAVAVLAGCQIEENFAPKESAKTFYGNLEADATRAHIAASGDSYQISWSVNDRVSINGINYYAAEGGAAYTYFVKDTSIEDPAGPYTAYYPAEITPVSSDIPGSLPGSQIFKNGTTTFVPMMATSETVNLNFKNLCSMLQINITTTDAAAAVKKIEIKADQPMAGKYTVVDGAAVVAEGTGVTLFCDQPVAIGATAVPFFVSVPVNTYTGMVIKVTLADGRNQTLKMKASASLKLERAKVYEATFPFNNFVAGPAATGKAVLLAGPEFNAAVKGIASGVLYEDEDLAVKHIVFDVLNPTTEGTLVSDATSEVPVYATFDKGSGVVTIATAADKIYLNENASSLFYRFNALKSYENLNVLNSENTTDMSFMFSQSTPTYTDLYDLTEIDLSWINTEKVVNMQSMFNSVRGVKKFDLSKFNTSNVENMRYMFGNCRGMESVDLTSFDFSKDTSLAYMFYYNIKLTDVKFPENINTSNVVNFRNMFYNCEILPSVDVSKFNTSSACDLYGVFYYCGMLTKLDVSNWDFSKDSTISYLFAYDSALVDLTLPKSIDCSEMTNMASSFRYTFFNTFDLDVFKNTENVLGMRYMFAYCHNLQKVTAKEFDFSGLVDRSQNTALGTWGAGYMFGYSCKYSLKLDLSEFNTETMTTWAYMFSHCYAADLNLDNWDTSNACDAYSMNYMFPYMKNLARLRLGEKFDLLNHSSPNSCFCASTNDKNSGAPDATGMAAGAITIECTQECADWIATTLWRHVNSGYYTGTPVPITFKDLTSGAVLSVTWKQ